MSLLFLDKLTLIHRCCWSRKKTQLYLNVCMCVKIGRMVMVHVVNWAIRFITMIPWTGPGGPEVDLRTLRAIRVLRPLKLVSGIPSE